MKTLLASLMALSLLGAACTEKPPSPGDEARGLLALPDGGFVVAVVTLADAAHDTRGTLMVQRHAADGTRVSRTVLAQDQPRTGRVLMKRLAPGQIICALPDAAVMFVISSDGATVLQNAPPGSALSRMKVMTDWLVGGVDDDGHFIRYRLGDDGSITPQVTTATTIAAGSTVRDVRATGTGGLAVLTGTTLTVFDASGQSLTSHPIDAAGPLLDEASGSVRVAVAQGPSSKIVTLDSTGGMTEQALGIALPSTLWPIDGGGITGVDDTHALLLGADGTTKWNVLGSFGGQMQIVSDGTRTLIASKPTGRVFVDDLDATGTVTRRVDLRHGEWNIY